jgi:hypothetical protein
MGQFVVGRPVGRVEQLLDPLPRNLGGKILLHRAAGLDCSKRIIERALRCGCHDPTFWSCADYIYRKLFFQPEQYRRTGDLSIPALLDKNPSVTSAALGGRRTWPQFLLFTFFLARGIGFS